MSIDRKAKVYKIICPECKEERFVTYAQDWNIKKGKCSGRCIKCNINRNTKGLEKGHGWNKGLAVSGMSGHKQSATNILTLKKEYISNGEKKFLNETIILVNNVIKKESTFNRTMLKDGQNIQS